MDLSELARALPKAISELELADDSCGLRYAASSDPRFVIPPIEVIADSFSGQVVLLSAPAATGKSSAARFLAREAVAPIFDLSTVQVGSGSLSGQVLDAFGLIDGPAFLKDVQAGKATIIVDALDEAEVQAGERNFQSFLLSICHFARNSQARSSIVLVGRSETMDWVEITMIEEGVDVRRVELEFFDEKDSGLFIDLSLDSWYETENKKPRHRTSRVPFEECRELLFRQAYELFNAGTLTDPWSNRDLRRFLGYAPVLQAFAKYLFHDNHHSLKAVIGQAEGGAPNSGQWALLLRLMDDLLIRERNKFVDQVWPTIEGLMDSPTPGIERLLYSPEEQCARLIAKVERRDAPPELPLSLPETVRGPYEAAAITFLANHPFLGGPSSYVSVVFRDYIFAVALSGRTMNRSDSASVRHSMSSTDYLPTPLLAGLLLSLSAVDGVFSVGASDVGFVVESLLSRQRKDEGSYTVILGDKEKAEASIGFWNEGTGSGESSLAAVQFEISDPVVGLTFPSRLSQAEVSFDGEITLGGRGESFILGPDVTISCDELMLVSSEVRALTNVDDSATYLKARMFVSQPSHNLVKVGPGKLNADWPEIAYPWHSFAARLIPPSRTATVWKNEPACVEFRRIIVRFRSKKDNKLFCHGPFMDNFILKGNPVALRVMAALIAKGCVSKGGDTYMLDLSRLSIGYVEVRQNNRNSDIISFVDDLMG